MMKKKILSVSFQKGVGLKTHSFPFEVVMRLVMVAVVLAIAVVGGATVRSELNTPPGMVMSTIGAILVLLGVSLAIWARVHLGRNWSSHPSLKVGHELITSGPYALVRHPIYTGVIVSALGSALVTSAWWLVILLFLVILFVRRIYIEEATMTAQFPDKYPEYKKRTWALVPWVW